MKTTESKEELLGSKNNVGTSRNSLQNIDELLLGPLEKKFLLYAERGDVATIRRLIDQHAPSELDINCVDPLNRSALISAIENENIELIKVLLEHNIKVKDALLHAIKEEYVEAVEILLEWEEEFHEYGQPYSWEAVDRASSNFTPDITPLILAAHMNNYEILKILLDRGATLPSPHDVRCGCDDCILSQESDSLRHSQSRINAYKALSSPSLISLSSRDPLLTAFELSWELRRLSFVEAEFRSEYNEMRAAVQEFATSLLDHARTSYELDIMLNFDPYGEVWEPGERQTLERLKLAIKYKQKKFVAHPNVQQLLAAIWYEGLPGFRRKNVLHQLLDVAKMGCMFPVYCTLSIIAPNTKMGQAIEKPFVKFICNSASYAFFLMLLGAASQRVEWIIIELFGNQWLRELLVDWKRKERGSIPGFVEGGVMIFMLSLIFNEMQALWSNGLKDYVSDLWNIIDFIANCFYMIWMFLRFTALFVVWRESWSGLDPYIPREQWHPFEPMLLSEGAFAAGMIFSFLKLVHIFSVNPHLGPLQISLGRMIIDIIKFFFIYTLVLFAYGCGMNQLMWYYADLEKTKCYTLADPTIPNFEDGEKACTIWRRFANLFETSQSLFWASFGLVDLMSFDLEGIKSFTRFWALLLFGSYSVINIIVLLNMLIAMMSSSYQIISERSDVEWKFARSNLWISYFDEGGPLPAPFNCMPSLRMFGLGKRKRSTGSTKMKSCEKAQERHDRVMRLLVRRYVTAEQRKRDDFGITEDDVMEIRQDISTLKYELVDILKTNGMKTPHIPDGSSAVSKKTKVIERRLQKDFQIGIVEGIVKEAITSDKGPKDVFSKIAKAIGKRTTTTGSKRKDWNAIVRRSTMRQDPIGRNEERLERRNRQSIRKYIIDKNAQLSKLDPEKLVEYNPMLSGVTPATRVAYAKFKLNKIKQEYETEAKTSSGAGDGLKSVKMGDDDVFKASASLKSGAGASPKPSPSKLATSESGSIIRPRPKKSVINAKQSFLNLTAKIDVHELKDQAMSVNEKTQQSSEIKVESDQLSAPEDKKDFRSRTPIQEDPRESLKTPVPPKENDNKAAFELDKKVEYPIQKQDTDKQKPDIEKQKQDTDSDASEFQYQWNKNKTRESDIEICKTPASELERSRIPIPGSTRRKVTSEQERMKPFGQEKDMNRGSEKEKPRKLATMRSKQDKHQTSSQEQERTLSEAKSEESKRPAVTKPGRSKVTGEFLTGWL